MKALDGVTSALEMESGVPDFAKFVAVRQGKALINYGATVSQEAARVLAFGDTLATSVMEKRDRSTIRRRGQRQTTLPARNRLSVSSRSSTGASPPER